MNTPTQAVLDRLEQQGYDPRSIGPDSWESRCPAHDGGRHNLSIKSGDDGRCLVYCHHVDETGNGCTTEAILSSIGLTIADLFVLEVAGSGVTGKSGRASSASKPRKVHPTFKAAVNAVLWGLRQPRGGKADESWRYLTRWVYRKLDGTEAFAVARFQNSAGDAGEKSGKDYRPIHRSGTGYAIGDPSGVLPLYHLPDLPGCRRVYVTEGEKCADLVRGIGLAATTPSHGAKSPHKTAWSPLAGLEVVILPDADAPGEGFAKAVVAQLAKLEPAPTVRIVRLPGLGDGDDIEQWLAARGDDPAHDAPWRTEAKEELERTVDSTPAEEIHVQTERPPGGQDDSTVDGKDFGPRLAEGTWVKALDRDNFGRVVEHSGNQVSVRFVSPSGHEAVVSFLRSELECVAEAAEPVAWSSDPRPLRSQLPPVPAMPEELIAEALRPWLVDIAERVSCSLDFPVVGAVNSLAALVGRKIAIRPKRFDDWSVVPNLWGGIVGRPGVFKTPALLEAMRMLYRLIDDANERNALALKDFQANSLVAKLESETARDALKKAVKSKASSEEIEKLAILATAAENLSSPPERRYMANDPTVEKLGELLRDNPSGLLIFRDELTGWLRGLDKPGRECDRAFYLESWNGGGGSFTYDRIGRGTVIIPSPCVSILGGIQPGVLRNYLKAIRSGEEADDGLISRFQLLVYPDPPSEWRNVDRWPNTAAKKRAFDVFRALDALDPMRVGAEADDNVPPFLRFTGEAQDLFDEWRTGLENEKLRVEGESPLIESHLAKYRSLMPSLALLFHLIEAVDGREGGPVSLGAAQTAAAWCDFLEAHARRIYAIDKEGDIEPARALAERIKGGALPDPFTARDVYRHGWSNLAKPEDVSRAVALLEDHGWVKAVETRQTGGAPRTDVHIHPSLAAKGRGE